jgi:hypothetical protein
VVGYALVVEVLTVAHDHTFDQLFAPLALLVTAGDEGAATETPTRAVKHQLAAGSALVLLAHGQVGDVGAAVAGH